MLRGMIVQHEGQPMVVRSIQSNNPSPGRPRPASIYGLIPLDGGLLTYLTAPTAEAMPLLPRCPRCGPAAEPGHFGAPGWRCHPMCATGTKARAQG